MTYASQIDFEVRRAGRSRFQVVTPQWLGGDDLKCGGADSKGHFANNERGRSGKLNYSGRCEATIPCGCFRLCPWPSDGTVPAAVVRPLGVERSQNHLVLENLTVDEITATTVSGAAPLRSMQYQRRWLKCKAASRVGVPDYG